MNAPLLPLSATLVALLMLAAGPGRVAAGKFTVTEEAWFEVEIAELDGPGTTYRGQFTIALFGDTVPMTVMNFAAIVRGYKRGDEDVLHYKNTTIHRVVPDFLVQMGDVTVKDGTGSRSIYGESFIDENFILSHRSPGWVSMANSGADSNGSQFFILLSKSRWLDGKHVVFGKVVRGFDTVRTIGDVPGNQETATPKVEITIVDCGLNQLDRKYDLRPEELDSTEDL